MSETYVCHGAKYPIMIQITTLNMIMQIHLISL
jgi:hypothetical protein